MINRGWNPFPSVKGKTSTDLVSISKGYEDKALTAVEIGLPVIAGMYTECAYHYANAAKEAN